jgi:hypothetical protein
MRQENLSQRMILTIKILILLFFTAGFVGGAVLATFRMASAVSFEAPDIRTITAPFLEPICNAMSISIEREVITPDFIVPDPFRIQALTYKSKTSEVTAPSYIRERLEIRGILLHGSPMVVLADESGRHHVCMVGTTVGQQTVIAINSKGIALRDKLGKYVLKDEPKKE